MNFHGWIALPLETKAREIGISVSADSIECGQFIEVMFQILDSKKISYEKFKKKCLPYKDIPASGIPEEKSFDLYDDFKSLIQMT